MLCTFIRVCIINTCVLGNYHGTFNKCSMSVPLIEMNFVQFSGILIKATPSLFNEYASVYSFKLHTTEGVRVMQP